MLTDGTSHLPTPACVRLVILGATGDLTGRYLLRALGELTAAGQLPPRLEIVAVARDDLDETTYRAYAAGKLDLHAPELDSATRQDLLARLRYVRGDATDPATLRTALSDDDDPALVYLALPASVFQSAVAALVAAGLPEKSRIVVEKPFGVDRESARDLNAFLHQHFEEPDVFRIDHFLGKQTVQNILGLRFANRVFEPLWCEEHIEAVDIVWDETLALEGRAGYYDNTGALRDMIQNHLLQLMCFVAMERPVGLGERPLRDAKAAVLRAVAESDDTWRGRSRRARYTAGTVEGRVVPDYADEPGVDPGRGTETFAEVTLFVDSDRWRGVPFRLRTGKALRRGRRQIQIRFRPVERLPFGQAGEPGPNVLTLSVDPDRVALDVALNGAGDPFCLDPARIVLDLAPQELSAYARLLVDALEGDAALFTRGDEAEESWRIVEPILNAWQSGAVPMETYAAGSDGPV